MKYGMCFLISGWLAYDLERVSTGGIPGLKRWIQWRNNRGISSGPTLIVEWGGSGTSHFLSLPLIRAPPRLILREVSNSLK
jgi:hypothetical protein